MAFSLANVIANAVSSQTKGVEIPTNKKESILNGLSESIFGGLTQTAATAGGIDKIKNLLTGKSNEAIGTISDIAGKIFTQNIAGQAGIPAILTKALTGKIPSVVNCLSGVLKDQDGDGDVDLQDVLLALKGNAGGGLLGAATSILGGMFKKS